MSLIFITAKPSLADRPKISIENSVERNSTIGYNFETITDTYKQAYTLDYYQTITDRLILTSLFKITLDDVIVSDDVDTKTFLPSVTLSFVNPVWDLNLSIEDSIVYTNEFNKRRSDAISSSLTANMFLFYLPPLKLKVDRIVNRQENLEDSVEEKIDATTSYSLGTATNLEASWKETQTEDFLDATTTRDKTWTASVSYGRPLWAGLKLDEALALSGVWTSSSDFDASVFSIETEQTFDNKVKFTLAGFPGIDSSLEIATLREFVEDQHRGTDTTTLAVDYVGGATKVGELRSAATLTLENLSDPDPADAKGIVTQEFSVEYGGSPIKYLDYTTKVSTNITDTDSSVASADQTTQENSFDLSMTFHPRDDANVETGWTSTASYTDGELTSTVRTLKLNLDYSEENTNVPGLSFTPTLTITNAWDRTEGTVTRSKVFTLNMEYSNSWPDPFTLKLTPSYSWNKTGTDDPVRDIQLNYQFEALFPLAAADCKFSFKGDYNNTLNDQVPGGEFTLEKEVRVLVAPRLGGRLRSSVDFDYKIAPDGNPSDTTTLSLGYTSPRFYNADVNMTLENTRIFGGPKNVERVITVKLGMSF